MQLSAKRCAYSARRAFRAIRTTCCIAALVQGSGGPNKGADALERRLQLAAALKYQIVDLRLNDSGIFGRALDRAERMLIAVAVDAEGSHSSSSSTIRKRRERKPRRNPLAALWMACSPTPETLRHPRSAMIPRDAYRDTM
jgi:hypothetical protein